MILKPEKRMRIRDIKYISFKVLCFIIFGLSSIPFTFILCPLVILFSPSGNIANNRIRRLVSRAFQAIVSVSCFLGIISVKINNREALKSSTSMLICANHPSFMDVIILIGLIENADCIVKASLFRNIFIKHVISKLYIPNSLHPEETFSACRDSLESGANLIIFPEGTRTVNSEQVKFSRSAAHIALNSDFYILPVHIAVDDPAGFGKGQSFFSIPKNGTSNYVITPKEPISVTPYQKLSKSIGARQLTDDLKAVIF